MESINSPVLNFHNLLAKELVVAQGCTEPAAIALAGASIRDYVKGNKILEVEVLASGNVIKNAMSVMIGGTKTKGIDMAAALGIVIGQADMGLQLLQLADAAAISSASLLVEQGVITVKQAHVEEALYIEVRLKTDLSFGRAIIENEHTHLALIEVQGRVLYEDRLHKKDSSTGNPNPDLNLQSIWDFIEQVDPLELDIIRNAITLNMALAMEGLHADFGLKVGQSLFKKSFNSDSEAEHIRYAAALTAAACDARMGGSSLCAMSNSGSGNQGIAATLPIVAYAEKLDISEDDLLKAVALSHLIAIYIKSKVGRLSGYCGMVIASIGAAGGIIYLKGGAFHSLECVVKNMLGTLTGMICDGAKAGCALKAATCTYTAFQSVLLADLNLPVPSADGIVVASVEDSIDNYCLLANEVGHKTDEVLLQMLLNK